MRKSKLQPIVFSHTDEALQDGSRPSVDVYVPVSKYRCLMNGTVQDAETGEIHHDWFLRFECYGEDWWF